MIKAVAVTASLALALAAPAKCGVASEVRHAIDAFYTADHHGTAQQLLQACADAGAPQ